MLRHASARAGCAAASRSRAAAFPALPRAAPPASGLLRWTAHSFATMPAPPMVYIKGEEMTAYTMELVMDQWVRPHVDTSRWEFFDLSCRSRDDSDDKVLYDAVAAGARLCSIFKEPTVTPSAKQASEWGLKKAWGSPNGVMRRGWNGITISRDTIHIEGMELGYKKPVFFERHAVGGEYSAGWKEVGKGWVQTIFFPEPQKGEPVYPTVVDSRLVDNDSSVVVVYDNPLDNVTDLAHHFFSRCLKAGITPYVVTKKTVFKWQEGFWLRMKQVFDAHYKEDYIKSGLLENCGGELQHLISDAATMQIIRWTQGGFGMAAHNYDGDMLTDEISQVHRSPGFITSNLIGKRDDGTMIKEFEASHGTVTDMWKAHLAGKETSLNPLGMVEALVGAVEHSIELAREKEGPNSYSDLLQFIGDMRKTVHKVLVSGKGTRDISGPTGLTTEQFVTEVANALEGVTSLKSSEQVVQPIDETIDEDLVRQLFGDLDMDGNGTIDIHEFMNGLKRLKACPRKLGIYENKKF